MSERLIMEWMNKITQDARLNIWHKSMFLAMLQISTENNSQNPFQISRKRVMEIAKIKSIATYHKYLKDLQTFRYIEYMPSYHPMFGSRLYIKP